MIGVEIIEADATDLPSMMTVMRTAFPARFGEAWTEAQTAGMLAMPGTAIWLAMRADLPIGFALTRQTLDEAELLMLAVDPQHRGKGVGRRLLDQAMASARTRGVLKMFLEMREGNEAEQLYKSIGFSEIGRRSSYYRGPNGERYDAITFSIGLTE